MQVRKAAIAAEFCPPNRPPFGNSDRQAWKACRIWGDIDWNPPPGPPPAPGVAPFLRTQASKAALDPAPLPPPAPPAVAAAALVVGLALADPLPHAAVSSIAAPKAVEPRMRNVRVRVGALTVRSRGGGRRVIGQNVIGRVDGQPSECPSLQSDCDEAGNPLWATRRLRTGGHA